MLLQEFLRGFVREHYKIQLNAKKQDVLLVGMRFANLSFRVMLKNAYERWWG